MSKFLIVNGSLYKDSDGNLITVPDDYDNNLIKLNNNLLKSGTSLIGKKSSLPVKGQLITMNLDGTSRIYRVLNINGNIAEVLAMFEANSSQPFDSTSPYSNVYAGSDLDTYLNTTWYGTLTTTAKSAIVAKSIKQQTYKYSDAPNDKGNTTYTYQYQYNWNNSDWENANYVSEVTVGNRYVYAPSIKDIFDYQGSREISSNELMKLFFNVEGKPSVMTYPWLRDAYAGTSFDAWRVRPDGGRLNSNYVYNSCAARPALCIDLSKINWT